PVCDQRLATKMAAGGVAADKKPTAVAAESGGVFVGPCDGVADLLRHDADIALRRADGNEIENDKIDPGIYKEFGGKCVVLRFAAPPGTAVHEDKNRCVWRPGRKYIEGFYRRCPVAETLGLTKTRTGFRAARTIALQNLSDHRSIFRLIIRGIEFDLIHVQPDLCALIVRCRPHLTSRGKAGCRRERGCGANRGLEHGPAIKCHGRFPWV